MENGFSIEADRHGGGGGGGGGGGTGARVAESAASARVSTAVDRRESSTVCRSRPTLPLASTRVSHSASLLSPANRRAAVRIRGRGRIARAESRTRRFIFRARVRLA